MSDDDADLRAAMHRQAQVHQPDPDRIRRRFEAGTQTAPGAVRHRSQSGSPSTTWWRSARTRLVLTRLAPVAVACAVAAIAWQGGAVTDRDRGTLLIEAGGGTAESTRPPGQVGTATAAGPQPTQPSPAPSGAIGTAQGLSPSSQSTTPTPLTPSRSPTAPTASVTSAPPTSSPPSLTPQSVGPGSPLCQRNSTIVLAPYYVSNNLWGSANGTGSQCIEAGGTGPGRGIAWRTSWSWSGGPGQVKSYGSAVLGWHWGWRVQGTGLPIKVADKRPIVTSWEFAAEPAGGAFDVGYDLWFHDIDNPSWSDSPAAEVRIIVYGSASVPKADPAEVVTIDGIEWEVHMGRNSWDVITFYSPQHTTDVDLDLAKFIDVAGRSTRLTYLSSIEAGINVIEGSGQVTTSDYSVTVS